MLNVASGSLRGFAVAESSSFTPHLLPDGLGIERMGRIEMVKKGGKRWAKPLPPVRFTDVTLSPSSEAEKTTSGPQGGRRSKALQMPFGKSAIIGQGISQKLTLSQNVNFTKGKPSTVKLRLRELFEKGYLVPKGQRCGARGAL